MDWGPIHYQWAYQWIGTQFIISGYPFISNNYNFFQDSIQLERHVLSDRQDVLPFAFQYWNQQCITL